MLWILVQKDDKFEATSVTLIISVSVIVSVTIIIDLRMLYHSSHRVQSEKMNTKTPYTELGEVGEVR